MKRKSYPYFALSTIILVLVVVGGAVISSYHKKITSLEKQVVVLQEKSDQYKNTISFVSNSSDLKEQTYNFKEWKGMQTLARNLVKKSDGEFKKEWALFLVHLANRYEIDPYIVFELLRVETGGQFNPELKGPKTKYGRAYGLSQFMKNTAPWIAEMADLKYKDELLFDPYYSIQLSIVYLDFLYNRYEGNWDKALTAYNRGIYGLEKFVETNGHAKSSYALGILSEAQNHRLIAYSDIQ
jgi:soluble lytic murein transglycosylase-like protein